MSPKSFRFEILSTHRFVSVMKFSGSGRQIKKSKGSLATKSSSKISVDDGDGDGKLKFSEKLRKIVDGMRAVFERTRQLEQERCR